MRVKQWPNKLGFDILLGRDTEIEVMTCGNNNERVRVFYGDDRAPTLAKLFPKGTQAETIAEDYRRDRKSWQKMEDI